MKSMIEKKINVIEEIESLRDENTPEEIEEMFLSGKLGKVCTHNDQQFIAGNRLSHLIIEIHEPGFIEDRTKEIVHHKDGNPLNNVYSNLQVMSIGEHVKLHRIDPKFAETEKVRVRKLTSWYADEANVEAIEARGKSISNWWKDKANAETVKKRNRKQSNAMIAFCADPENADTVKERNRKISVYYANPKNAEAIKARNKAISKFSQRNWIDLSIFKKLFTIKEYAEASKIRYATAAYRLRILLSERQINCEEKLIDSCWHNVYIVVKKERGRRK